MLIPMYYVSSGLFLPLRVLYIKKPRLESRCRKGLLVNHLTARHFSGVERNVALSQCSCASFFRVIALPSYFRFAERERSQDVATPIRL